MVIKLVEKTQLTQHPMTYIHAFILGLIQALTEFFPISSSAHLKLTKFFLNISDSQESILFDLSCHLGSLIAVLYFFRKEIFSIFSKERKTLFLLFIAMCPLVPAYFILKPLRDFASQPKYLGYCLFLTAIILFLGHHLRMRKQELPSTSKSFKDVLYIGVMQSAALIPGISRSASTISCAKFLGWNSSEAVKFSFLLSIPTILGGNTLELAKHFFSQKQAHSLPILECSIAFLTSLIAGSAVIKIAMKILEKGKLKPFAYYCMGLGLLAFFL
ncbi:MAG: undecaprenyl-diphosphate phosphatase, partial [Chlamydiae bacterium]|nr:undecaprenyl-diphosphate phosphatase [Chlamydiota bacterium]